MFSYNICTQADENVFRKQCAALEKNIPEIQKVSMLEDVDGSQTQIYNLNGQQIKVCNSYYIDAVFIDSEAELESYFGG